MTTTDDDLRQDQYRPREKSTPTPRSGRGRPPCPACIKARTTAVTAVATAAANTPHHISKNLKTIIRPSSLPFIL
ncbi:hypothetical protein V1478_002049 [Vespula squamosa]|uniref:Uncharacterized protein n=1 Tax=Vespula squamosa TaxID=30214 RepID=A0ABD2BYV6_VESSQ